LPLCGFFESFSSISSEVVFKFFSTSSLNIEDLKRRLRAVEEDDLVRGLTGSVFL
jgi:hypothetical protein